MQRQKDESNYVFANGYFVAFIFVLHVSARRIGNFFEVPIFGIGRIRRAVCGIEAWKKGLDKGESCLSSWIRTGLLIVFVVKIAPMILFIRQTRWQTAAAVIFQQVGIDLDVGTGKFPYLVQIHPVWRSGRRAGCCAGRLYKGLYQREIFQFLIIASVNVDFIDPVLAALHGQVASGAV